MISSVNGVDFVCLSTDTKPTTPEEMEELGYGYSALQNGMTMLEMDTSEVYMFDAANTLWRKL